MRPLGLLTAMLGVLLAACAPAIAPALPPEEPLVFQADYDALFDATLQAVTVTSLRGPAGQRLRYVVTEADRDTGLITAVHGTTADALFRARRTFVAPGSDFTFGFRVDVPIGRTQPQHVLSLVVRPEAAGSASLVYSSTTAAGLESALGNSFMARVIGRLNERFAAPVG